MWQDEDAFFVDYAASHKKLSELGFRQKSGSFKSKALGVAVPIVVALVVILVLKAPYFKDSTTLKDLGF